MKNVLILSMLTIFIFACNDEGAAGPQEEEVIEEIFFYNHFNGEGNTCDSIFIYKDYSTVTYRQYCVESPLFDTNFYFSDIGNSFLDTFLLNDTRVDYTITSDSIFSYIEFDKLFNANDTIFINIASNSGGILGTKIKVITNYREKQIFLKGVKSSEGDVYIRRFYLLLNSFSDYHFNRLRNLHGRSY